MMTYTTSYYYIPQYERTSSNQHGNRFKQIAMKRVNVVKLSCKRTCAISLEDLIILGHTLKVPVHYNFDDNTVYIEIMSSEAVREIT